MTSLLKRLIRDDEGATMVEYGVMLALICAICIPIVTILGTQVQATFNTVSGAL